MRVVYVLDRFPALSETWVVGELRELLRTGDDVLVLARSPGDDVPIPDDLRRRIVHPPRRRSELARAVLRAVVTRPGRTLPALVWALRARPRERGVLRAFGEATALCPRVEPGDHLHAHFAHNSASLALLLGRLTGRPFSFTGHAYDVLVATPPALLRRKIGAARFTVAVSEWSRARLAHVARPEDRTKVVVVRNGVDVGEPARAGDRDAAARPLVLTVARLVDKKGIDLAVQACALLRARGVEHRWVVAGDGPLRERLEAQARELGVEDTLTLAGALAPHAIRDHLSAAAVFALPCRVAADGDQDVLPAAIVEALAAGVPVVSTPVGGIPELGPGALLVPSDDAAALAEALAGLLGDAGRRAELAKRGRRAALEYDVRDSVARLRALIEAERTGGAVSPARPPDLDAAAAA